MNAARLGLAAACGAGFLWGTGALVVDVLVARHGFTPENISFWRFVVGAVVLLAGVGISVASAVLYAGFTLVSGRLSDRLGAGPAAAGLTVVAAAAMGLFGFVKPLHWPAEVAPEAWFLHLGVVTAALALLAALGRRVARPVH